jgi:Heavy metal binding domain
MLHLRLAVLALLALCASPALGCIDGTLPPVTSPADPSSSSAPEAPFSPPPRTLAEGKLPPSAAPAAPLAGAVYTCPMHAQIAEGAPGACPICGMTLIPRPGAAPGHDHHNHGGAK